MAKKVMGKAMKKKSGKMPKGKSPKMSGKASVGPKKTDMSKIAKIKF